MSATVQFRGQTYRVGDPGISLPLDTIAPGILPREWSEVDNSGRLQVSRTYARSYRSTAGMVVLLSATIREGKRWLHISVTHRGGRVPHWREMCRVKDIFCGEARYAYQVHPPRDKHVSIHPGCLHLWCPLDGPVTPDFTGGGETI